MAFSACNLSYLISSWPKTAQAVPANQGHNKRRFAEVARTPSPGPPRLKKTPVRSTLSPKGERAGIRTRRYCAVGSHTRRPAKKSRSAKCFGQKQRKNQGFRAVMSAQMRSMKVNLVWLELFHVELLAKRAYCARRSQEKHPSESGATRILLATKPCN